MTTLSVIMINLHTQLTTNLHDLFFQFIIWYIIWNITKFHIVPSAILFRLSLTFFQVNHTFLQFAVDYFNNSEFTIDLLVCRC